MSGQRIGYVRVSSADQNTERQEVQLAGLKLHRVFTDKVSGKDTNRPALKELQAYARLGDTVYVHSLDRLGRNLDDLRKIVRDLTDKGISVEFVKENLRFNCDEVEVPITKLLFSIMGAFAEFERNLIKERQREGIAIAKAAGAYKGRKRSMTDDRIAEIKQRIEKGDKKAQIAREMGISRETLYQYL
jgi:DNA invertase Pin-like site-specific DNA recombinase